VYENSKLLAIYIKNDFGKRGFYDLDAYFISALPRY